MCVHACVCVCTYMRLVAVGSTHSPLTSVFSTHVGMCQLGVPSPSVPGLYCIHACIHMCAYTRMDSLLEMRML